MKLKRCPFCNSHNLTMDIAERIISIRCLECGAMGPSSAGPASAAYSWNKGQKGSTALVNLPPGQSNRDDLKEVDV